MKKIIAELDPKSNIIQSRGPKQSATKSKGLIDRWLVRNQRVGYQTIEVEDGRDELDEKEKDLSIVGNKKHR